MKHTIHAAFAAFVLSNAALAQDAVGPFTLFSELPQSIAFEVYVSRLQNEFAEAGFTVEGELEPVPLGRGEVFDLVAVENGAIGLVFLEDRIREGDGAAALLTTPAAFPTFGESRQAQQSFVGDLARSEITEGGVLAVGLWTHTVDALVTSISVADVDDLQGLRVRINDLPSETFFANLGASPQQMVFAEVFTALQTGAVDAVLWPQEQVGSDLLSLAAGGTVIPDHRSRIAMTVVGEDWWNGLGAGVQRRFLTALERAEVAAAATVGDQRMSLAALAEEFEVSMISWEEFPIETIDAAILSSAEEAAFVEAGSIQHLFEDAQSFWEDTLVVPQSNPTPDRRSPPGEANVFFTTDRRYDPQFDPLTDRFANIGGDSGIWYCGELVPAAPFDLGEVVGEVELVDGTVVAEGQDCVSIIAAAVAAAGGRVLIYVHGYRNDFLQATSTGLAFSRDLHLDMPLVVWSWPSAGALRNYPRDADAVDWSEFQFGRFVRALASSPGVQGVDIMAHSMGTRLAANLMRDDWPGGDAAVVLAAADIARMNLRQAVDEAEHARVTILVSRGDVALFASEFLSSREPRVGRASPLFIHPGIDTIDLSVFDGIALNHRHVFEVPEVVNDLMRVFAGEWRAVDRGLEVRRNHSSVIDHYVIDKRSN